MIILVVVRFTSSHIFCFNSVYLRFQNSEILTAKLLQTSFFHVKINKNEKREILFLKCKKHSVEISPVKNMICYISLATIANGK